MVYIVLQVLAAIYFCESYALASDHFQWINIRHLGYVAVKFHSNYLVLHSQTLDLTISFDGWFSFLVLFITFFLFLIPCARLHWLAVSSQHM